MLPVTLLNEPSDSTMIREKDDKFIVRLKEMLDDPIMFSQSYVWRTFMREWNFKPH